MVSGGSYPGMRSNLSIRIPEPVSNLCRYFFKEMNDGRSLLPKRATIAFAEKQLLSLQLKDNEDFKFERTVDLKK
jgi:hypothetical protein